MLRRSVRRFAGIFDHVPEGPPDPILGLGLAYAADTFPKKVNLGVGVYRGDDGKPFVLNCVRKAEERVFNRKLDFEYAPISGANGFVDIARNLAFGTDCAALKDKRIASAQSLSGTGALRLAGEFAVRYAPGTILLPNPSWGNHKNVFSDCKLPVGQYTYKHATKVAIDIPKMIADIQAAPAKSIFLLHACAHNPTGVDPTPKEWEAITDAIAASGHLPIVDMAYQGFASGDADRDALAWRMISAKVPCFIGCQSFAKSFGLYGQRVGAVHIQCSNKESAERVLSQLKIVIRPMYSNPPIQGARIIEEVFKDPALLAEWKSELKAMSDRMNGVRVRLVKRLAEVGSKRDWSHITSQIGMMAFTGLSTAQVDLLKKEYHIYMTADGRAAITGLNTTNVDYVADAFHAVTK